MQNAFTYEIESYVDEEIGLRRFRWRLKDPAATDFAASHTFATKREATKDAEIALARARQRGRLRP
ncbi:hypothetical protein [uncultured Enterovirga sp.]|uniref:hypothetical protein n=1 Tax=uncultured Enterovirga sp. TaxID=2026352 RepID=UPI0035CA0CC2